MCSNICTGLTARRVKCPSILALSWRDRAILVVSHIQTAKNLCASTSTLRPSSTIATSTRSASTISGRSTKTLAQFGCHVYSFDPSMGANDHNRTSKIHFFNLGLAKENGQSPNGWKMKTASSIYEMLDDYHGSSTLIDVFKMDIEFYEWEVIPQMVQSGFLRDKVKQLDSFLIILQRIVDILISTILWRITRNESASFKTLNRWIQHIFRFRRWSSSGCCWRIRSFQFSVKSGA